MDQDFGNIEVVSSLDYTIESIEQLYDQVFASHGNDNFFLSNEWMRNWLESAQNKPALLTFMLNTRVVGFVFIGAVKTNLGQIYYLNQTGNQQDDQIWIEYNDIICIAHHHQCRTALLQHLASKTNAFQFVATNLLHASWSNACWNDWSVQAINGYSTSLNETDVRTQFSKNTKRQISRSISHIEKQYGVIEMQVITKDQVHETLDSMAILHKKQWGTHEYGSGFNNPIFVAFHKKLLARGIHKDSEILAFHAGKMCLGYLHYFLTNKQVYFYLSALNYEDNDNKYKPGLVMHEHAMNYFSQRGFTTYDFLAGEARYKKSLSNKEYTLFSIKLYRNKWYYWPIKRLVNVKRWINKLIFSSPS